MCDGQIADGEYPGNQEEGVRPSLSSPWEARGEKGQEVQRIPNCEACGDLSNNWPYRYQKPEFHGIQGTQRCTYQPVTTDKKMPSFGEYIVTAEYKKNPSGGSESQDAIDWFLTYYLKSHR